MKKQSKKHKRARDISPIGAKGITLIALIITIIVMLILVAVTVNVAINGGLFNAAKDGAKKTQLEADKEVLQAGIIPSIDTNTLTIPNAQTLKDNLPEGWNVTGTDGGPYTATSPKENEFKVIKNGEIIDKEEIKVGKYVQYDVKNWIVLYDDETNGLQMISVDVLQAGKVYLGVQDETAQYPGDINGDGRENRDLDKAIYSYNNAIGRLNRKCASLVRAKEGIVKSVRSVGSNPVNPSSGNMGYRSSDLEKWAKGRYNGLGKSTDSNFKTDLDRMVELNIHKKESNYWMASRLVRPSSKSVSFNVRLMNSVGDCNGIDLWHVGSSGLADGFSFSCGVRPVVILEQGALDNLPGEGTAESPLILE